VVEITAFEVSVVCFLICIASELRTRALPANEVSTTLKRAAQEQPAACEAERFYPPMRKAIGSRSFQAPITEEQTWGLNVLGIYPAMISMELIGVRPTTGLEEIKPKSIPALTHHRMSCRT
jgi:hypothetical protein